MTKKSLLTDLINAAKAGCYESGEGCAESEGCEDLRVTADWTSSGDKNFPCVIRIRIFQDGIKKISYNDLATLCR